MYLEIRKVSRKTPGDGRLEVSATTYRSLEGAGNRLNAKLGESEGPCALISMSCSCAKGGSRHDHYFVQSTLFHVLEPDRAVRLDFDGLSLRLIITAMD